MKIEGNPDHPISQGAVCLQGHASLQHLYNPDRFAGPMIREGDVFRQGTWDEAERLLAARINQATTAGHSVMFVGGHLGPTMTRLVDQFVDSVGGSRVEYHAVSNAPLREATRIAYGTNEVPTYDIGASDFLLSFGNDFIDDGSVEAGRGLSHMSGLVDEEHSKGTFAYLGARLSTTGLNADEWLPIQPGSEAIVALAMAAHISAGNVSGPYAHSPRDLRHGRRRCRVRPQRGFTSRSRRSLRCLLEPACDGPGSGHTPQERDGSKPRRARSERCRRRRRPDGSCGSWVEHRIDAVLRHGRRHHRDGGWSGRCRAGSRNQSRILAAAGSGFQDAFDGVPFKVSFASAMDETAAMADLIMPDRHFLESWGDAMPRAGVHTVQQPVMQAVPHFDSKQAGDALLAVATHLGQDLGSATFYEYLRAPHQAMHVDDPTGFEQMWREHLRTGMFGMKTGVMMHGDAQAWVVAAWTPPPSAPHSGPGIDVRCAVVRRGRGSDAAGASVSALQGR